MVAPINPSENQSTYFINPTERLGNQTQFGIVCLAEKDK